MTMIFFGKNYRTAVPIQNVISITQVGKYIEITYTTGYDNDGEPTVNVYKHTYSTDYSAICDMSTFFNAVKSGDGAYYFGGEEDIPF